MMCQFLDKRLNELTMMVLMRQTESCDMLVYMMRIDMKLLAVETETADITVVTPLFIKKTMILESVKQGHLIWPSVEVEGVIRLKKYSELSAAEAIEADCDVKATNIILQGLPPEVYALVSTHKVAKELWKRI
nr:hypothetical protein [Tanacetum cinerariifolium]